MENVINPLEPPRNYIHRLGDFLSDQLGIREIGSREYIKICLKNCIIFNVRTLLGGGLFTVANRTSQFFIRNVSLTYRPMLEKLFVTSERSAFSFGALFIAYLDLSRELINNFLPAFGYETVDLYQGEDLPQVGNLVSFISAIMMSAHTHETIFSDEVNLTQAYTMIAAAFLIMRFIGLPNTFLYRR